MRTQTRNMYKSISIFLILLFLGLMSASVTHAGETYSLVAKWNSSNTQGGEFDAIHSIATDSQGNIYVADMGSELNTRIQKFDSNGNFITGLYDLDNEYYGIDDIAVDSEGNIYALDKYKHLVKKIDTSGNVMDEWETDADIDVSAISMDIDSEENIYIAYSGNIINKFDNSGSLITTWGSEGWEDGQFKELSRITVDSEGNVYASDFSRVQKFDSSGKFITYLGSKQGDDDREIITGHTAVDSSGNIYVAGGHQVSKFNSNGNLITKWGTMGREDGEFRRIDDIAVDSEGNLFVADETNHRIQKFAIITQDTEETQTSETADNEVTNEQQTEEKQASETTNNEVVNKQQTEEKQNTEAANNDVAEQTTTEASEQTENSKAPGFGIICGLIGLVAVFMYRRK